MSDILNLINAAEAELNRDFEAGRITANLADQRRDLLAALTRLIKGEPINPQLRDMMQDLGRIPVTQDMLALEAGIARQRFSGKKNHPIISELVRAAKPEFGVAETTTTRLRRLADQNRVLDQALRASRSACVVHILALEALQKQHRRNARKEARKAEDEA